MALSPPAVVFDLDGTLIDSAPDVAAALNRLLAERGRPELSLAEVQGLVGEGAGALIERAFAATGPAIAADEVKPAVARYLEFYEMEPAERTVIFPGTREVLARLAERGAPLGICTNKPYRMTLIVLKALGLDGHFATITGGDNLPFRKPDGRHILRTLQMMAADPARAVMIGDSATDVAAARDARIPVVAVSWGYPRMPLSALGADRVIESFDQLEATLAELVP